MARTTDPALPEVEVRDHPLQAIMSRTGSFPLRVAKGLLAKYGRPGQIVLDPFCGKGTSLLAARLLEMHAFGLDVAPEAVICSMAKLVSVRKTEVETYIKSIPAFGYDGEDAPPEVKVFFHPKTLQQILALRRVLLRDLRTGTRRQKEITTFVLAHVLGILHGHASYSLSISSAHAFSMSSNYVSKYAKEHGIVAPNRDVKACLISKIGKTFSAPIPKPVTYGVKCESALDASRLFAHLKGKVDIVLTSPPYLNAQTYSKDNWLRLWFLGYNHKFLRPKYFETGSIDRYRDLMTPALSEIRAMLKPGGLLICMAGDVVRKKIIDGEPHPRIFKTGEFLESLCENGFRNFRVLSVDRQFVLSRQRYFNALSATNGHSQKRLIERVFVGSWGRAS